MNVSSPACWADGDGGSTGLVEAESGACLDPSKRLRVGCAETMERAEYGRVAGV